MARIFDGPATVHFYDLGEIVSLTVPNAPRNNEIIPFLCLLLGRMRRKKRKERFLIWLLPLIEMAKSSISINVHHKTSTFWH